MSHPDPRTLLDALRAHVERLARAPREPRTREHREAARYIRARLEEVGLAVEERRSRSGDLPCANLITRPIPDRPDLPLLVVGAHYDTVPATPGADDNASAVAALLEIARWIGPRRTPPVAPAARLVLAAYDLEEYGFIGSSLHAGELARSRAPLAGMIALEMLGFTGDRQEIPPVLRGRYPETGNFIGVVANERSRDLASVVEAALRGVPGLPVESLAVPGAGEAIPETGANRVPW
ncbi:MAG: M28 family peptidase [Planctomycetes bacterium]|nr:M28 family peptidase [Planctomycetota bacterium]